MKFFNKNPVIRLTFVVIYLATAVWIVIRDFAWLNIFFALLMLFGCYIALVKSGIIKDAKANSVSDLRFDILSIAITGFLLIDILFKIM